MQDATYLRPAEAARFIGAGLSTLWRYAKQDPTFPTRVKLSSRLTLFRRVDLERWVESRHVEGGAA